MPLHLSPYPVNTTTRRKLWVERKRTASLEKEAIIVAIQEILQKENSESPLYQADISDIKIPWKNWKIIENLWEFIFDYSFNDHGYIYGKIGWNNEDSVEILKELHLHPNINWEELKKLSRLNARERFPFPPTLNNTLSPNVQALMEKISQLPLKKYEWKSLTELRGDAPAIKTFWDFGIVCLKNGIKLEA